MRPPWRSSLIILLAIILILLSRSANCQQLEFHCPHEKCDFDTAQALKVYWYVSAQIAREVNSEHPPKLEPRLKVIVGAKELHFYISPEGAELEMSKWDEGMFAQAVGFAAASQVLGKQKVRNAVQAALIFAHATTSVKELQHGSDK